MVDRVRSVGMGGGNWKPPGFLDDLPEKEDQDAVVIHDEQVRVHGASFSLCITPCDFSTMPRMMESISSAEVKTCSSMVW